MESSLAALYIFFLTSVSISAYNVDENLRCPEPLRYLDNGIVNRATLKVFYKEGATVEYKCNEGFYFETGPQAICSNGQWIYPQCREGEHLTCPDPEQEINNAKLNRTNLKPYYQEGGTVEYTCNEGFHSKTGTRATCTKRQWNYPQCIDLDENLRCPEPLRYLDNGTVNRATLKMSYEEGVTVEYKCNEGFYFETGPQAICSNGQWIYPQCREVGEHLTCPDPEQEINNAKLNRTNLKPYYQEGGTVEYTCNEGFHSKTGTRATCSKRQWNYPQCIDLDKNLRCPEPLRYLDNGIVNRATLKMSYEEGVTVEYKCNEGFYFETGPQAICSNGQWIYPQCREVDKNLRCPEPLRHLNHGSMIRATLKMSYEEGVTVQYKCNEGFYFETGPQAICSRGQWIYPQCREEIKCLPPAIPHGLSTPVKEYNENEVLRYVCERGYNARPEISRCTKYGWSITPECNEVVCLLEAPTNGVASTNPRGKNIFKGGEYVEIICQETFWVSMSNTGSKQIRCQENGKWETTPMCESKQEKTCENPRDSHMSYVYPSNINNYKLNELIIYACKSGYQAKGRLATCTKNGWEPKPECTDTEIKCLPPAIPHGLSTPVNIEKKNEVLRYVCERGYNARPEISRCTKYGWSITPECNEAVCLLEAPTNGVASTNPRGKNIFKGGEYVEIICQETFWVSMSNTGSKQIRCQENGKWETTPMCESKQEKTCENPRDSHMSYVYPININNYKLNEQIIYGCKSGYQAKGRLATCTKNGWEPKPECTDTEIKCLPPAIPHGLSTPVKEYKENEVLRYVCERGYNARPEISRCTKYGWSITPECNEAVCLLEAPTNGVASTNPRGKNIFKGGEFVEVICQETFWVSMSNTASKQIRCQENGKWETTPMCESKQEKTCENPRDSHMSYVYPSNINNYKLNEHIFYACKSGYQAKRRVATCTKNGWEPKPECTEI